MPSGSCICGDITYQFSGEPVMSALCHCHTCRKLTGSTNAAAILVPEQGANWSYSSKTNTPLKESHAIHETGLAMTFSSCSKCPSTLWKSAPEGFPGVLIVFAGGLDDQDGMEKLAKPQAELWVSQKVSWLPALEGTKQCQQFE